LMNIFRNGITKLFLNTVTTHKLFIFCSLGDRFIQSQQLNNQKKGGLLTTLKYFSPQDYDVEYGRSRG